MNFGEITSLRTKRILTAMSGGRVQCSAQSGRPASGPEKSNSYPVPSPAENRSGRFGRSTSMALTMTYLVSCRMLAEACWNRRAGR